MYRSCVIDGCLCPGTRRSPGLTAATAALHCSDTLVTTALNRLGRSTVDSWNSLL
jgi:DNA invertase Pin-like site-specific DNA recombinase